MSYLVYLTGGFKMEKNLDGKKMDYEKLILYPKQMDAETRHQLSDKLKELDVDVEYEEY